MTKVLRAWMVLCLMIGDNVWGVRDAQAHGLNPAGLAPFLVDGQMVGAATNLGLVVYIDDVPTWRTEMRVHGTLHWFGYTASGRVLVGTSNTLLVTEDGGCTFDGHSEAFGGVDVRSMVTDPSTARPHLIATATQDATNGIFSTPDGGDVWELVPGTEINGQYLSLRYSSKDGTYLALSTTDTAGSFTFSTLNMAGEIQQSATMEIEVADLVRLITPGAQSGIGFVAAFTRDEDADPVPMGTALPGTDNLYRVDYSNGTLELVDTLTESNRFYSGAVFAQEVYVTDYEDRFLRYQLEGLVEVGEEVRYCIDDSLSDDVFWACGRRPQDYTFFNSTDGENWEGVLLFDDIMVGDCPDKVPDEPSEPGDGVDLSGCGNGDSDASGTGDGNASGSDDISKGDLPGTSEQGGQPGDGVEKPIDESGCSASPQGLGWLLALLGIYGRWRRFRLGKAS